MRLVICLVFLASFALVCQGYKGTYTRPFSRPTGTRPFSPTVTGCSSCRLINFNDAVACCWRLGRCCSAVKG
uniref:Penaeidin n=1 Tax=Metapenaeus monoceros TaxID=1211424 RepID=A0AA50EWA8_9EUCA|nr:penaeidin [Metapenaeus monoceros]